MKTTTKTIRKMSDVVIFCELRSAWKDVECAVTHGVEPAKALCDYIAALESERARRESEAA